MIERGKASLKLFLDEGQLWVFHGESNELLFRSHVVEGTWEQIWSAIQSGAIREGDDDARA